LPIKSFTETRIADFRKAGLAMNRRNFHVKLVR